MAPFGAYPPYRSAGRFNKGGAASGRAKPAPRRLLGLIHFMRRG